MKFFDKIFSRKITSDQAIRSFKNFADAGIAGFRNKSDLFEVAFPQNNAAEKAVEVIEKDFRILDIKSKRSDQLNFFKSIYLKNKNELKLAHSLGSKVDESIAFFIIIQLDQVAKKNVISAFELEGEVALERYKNSYRADYLRRWLLYLIIETSLILTFEDLFGIKIDNEINVRYELMLDDHIKKLMAEVLISYDPSIWLSFNEKNTDYQFTALHKRSQAMSLFLKGVELNDDEIMEKGTSDFLKAIEINFNENTS